MSEHSDIIGGSTADRVISCPGSNRLIKTLPDWAKKRTSKYATTGTACHNIMAALLLNPDAPDPKVGEIVPTKDGDVVVTQEMVRAVDRAFQLLDGIYEQYPDLVWLVEQRVQFPGVDASFGTSDLVGVSRAAKRSFVLDWKFGTGVPVAACYDLDDGFEQVNRQLLYYATASRATLPHVFPEGHDVEVIIVQPLMENEDDRISRAVVSQDELDEFEDIVQDAVAKAVTSNAPLAMGAHCRFAPCKIVCPLHIAPMASLIESRKKEVKELTGDELGHLLYTAEAAEELATAIKEAAYARLERGEPVAGWKLVAKNAQRKWQWSEADLLKALRKLKVNKARALETKVKSPAQIEKLLPKGVKLPEGSALAVSSGHTLAHTDDKRPDVTDSLKALRDIARRNTHKALTSAVFDKK